MEPNAAQLRALLADLVRLEDRVWARNPEEAASGERRGEMLRYLMTPDEWREWRAVGSIVAELRKLI